MIRVTEHPFVNSFRFSDTPRAAEALGILPLSHRTLKVPSTLMARTIRTRPMLMIIRPPVAAARGIFPAITQASLRNVRGLTGSPGSG
jgi:hypothetical protein